MYWGNLSLLEDRSVEAAMVKFGEAIREADRLLGIESLDAAIGTSGQTSTTAEVGLTPSASNIQQSQAWYLEKLSYRLAHVFRGSLMDTWNPHGAFEQLFGTPDKQKGAEHSDQNNAKRAFAEMMTQPQKPDPDPS